MAYPRGAHRLSGGRDYRRVVATLQNDATGAGTGSSGSTPPVVLTYADHVLADSPASYWKFDEPSGSTVTDYGSNGKNLTLVNSPTLGVAGPVAGVTACTFASASSQSANTADAGSLLQTGDTFSIEFWLKRATAGASMGIYGKGISGGLLRVQIDASNNMSLLAAGVQNMCYAATAATADTSAWHHYVFTKSGATRLLYIDGASVATAGTNATISADASSLRVAIRADGTSNDFYNGSLGQMAYYTTALSAARVAAHYAARV